MIIHQSFQGPLPAHYRTVHRWITQQEVNLWTTGNVTHVPSGLGAAGRIYVTEPGAPKPGGTGPFRVEFAVPGHMLFAAGNTGWLQIVGPVENTPVLNVRVLKP